MKLLALALVVALAHGGVNGPSRHIVCTGTHVAVQRSRPDQKAEDRFQCTDLLPVNRMASSDTEVERGLYEACANQARKRRGNFIWDPDPGRSAFKCLDMTPPDECE
jgi:hypothetical protein